MEEKLFEHFEQKGKLTGLSTLQIEKFRFACLKSIKENPDLEFDDLLIACRIYLNFIINSPTVDLGPIQSPKSA